MVGGEHVGACGAQGVTRQRHIAVGLGGGQGLGQGERLRRQRDALAGALRDRLPDWQFRIPDGGLSLWCRLPRPVAAALAMIDAMVAGLEQG